MELTNEIIYIIISLASILVGIGIGFFLSKQNKSETNIKNDINTLEVENINLRSELANIKSPANDVHALKMKLNAHIIENEINIKKIFQYEQMIRELKEREFEKISAQKSDEIINRKIRELNKKLKDAEQHIVQLQDKIPAVEQPLFNTITKVEMEDEIPDLYEIELSEKASKINFDRIGHPKKNEKDDLKKIVGIGQSVEQKLNNVGIYSFQQIANFNDEDIRIVNEAIEFFPGRILKDNWVAQARKLLRTQSK
jgi:predicted flap endonuclease-1-like 5' DNA nuclease